MHPATAGRNRRFGPIATCRWYTSVTATPGPKLDRSAPAPARQPCAAPLGAGPAPHRRPARPARRNRRAGPAPRAVSAILQWSKSGARPVYRAPHGRRAQRRVQARACHPQHQACPERRCRLAARSGQRGSQPLHVRRCRRRSRPQARAEQLRCYLPPHRQAGGGGLLPAQRHPAPAGAGLEIQRVCPRAA